MVRFSPRPSVIGKLFQTLGRATRKALARKGSSDRAGGRVSVEGLEGRQLMAAQPTLHLLDAATGAVVETITKGLKVDLAGRTSVKVAAGEAGDAASLSFAIDGRPILSSGFSPADDEGWTPTDGDHVLTVTQFAKANGVGRIGKAATLKFAVSNSGNAAPVDPPVEEPTAGGGTGGTDAPATPDVPTPDPAPAPGSDPQPNAAAGGMPGETLNPAAPTAVIDVVGKSGMAGHPTVVNAVNSTLPNQAIRATYRWDFGDASGAYNTLNGWTAGHIYDRPGEYTVKLTVTDANGRSDTTTTTVNVAADSRRTVYVDAEAGNDGNNGSAASPIKSYARASQFAGGDNVRVLFKRGQTWNTNQWMSITGSNVMIGAYGEGAKPVLNVIGGQTAIQTFNTASNVVIQDLTFDSPYKPKGNVADKNGVSGIYVGGTQIGVRGCTFLNVTDGMNANQKPKGFIAQDNDAPSATGIRGYLLWVEGSDFVALGNSAANSTREHTMRIWHVDRMLAAYNTFTNLNRLRIDPRDGNKGTIEVQTSSWAYVYGNTLRGGPLRVGPRGTSVESRSTRSSYVVFENNKAYGHQINVYPGSQHLMIRNNVVYNDNGNGIAINSRDDEGRKLADINIIGNTVYNNGQSGNFLRTTTGLLAGTVTVGKNTFVAPNLISGRDGSGAMFVAENDLSGFKSIYNNTWPIPRETLKYAQGGVTWVAPTFKGQAGFKDPREWAAYPQVHGDVFKKV